ncbi:MAG: hypothetical protein ACYDA3_09065 [Gaiellaceae bacterium]
MRRLASTALYVTGYWLLSCLDANVALLPAIASFSAANTLLVRL